MILPSDQNPKLCKDCKSGFREPNGYVCVKAIDVVTGHSPYCETVRANDTHCGPAANWFERRMNTSAIVDQTPVYGYSKDGGRQYLGTLGDGAEGNNRLNQPIAENDKLKAYHPKDVNLDEWKRDTE